MKGTTRRRIGAVLTAAAALLLTLYPVLARSPEDEEVRRILEKSLSTVELDKEISRIAAQKELASQQFSEASEQLQQHEALMQEQQEKAGRVLRAYYMGERDIWLSALFSSNSLSDLLSMLDYFEYIFAGDRRQLNSYVEQYRTVKQAVAKHQNEAEQLARIEERLVAQKERLSALQKDVDDQLSNSSDEERLRMMIAEITDFWQNVGFYEVKRYFKALAQAMTQLPSWVQKNKDMLEINGFNYTITVSQDKLNTFLREQNELFNNFDFMFTENAVSVSGKREGLEVNITGHYTVEEEPINGIIFHVDELLFNGLALPDTTRSSLEKEFDLGFYPEKLVSFLQAKSVEVNDGQLIIKLSVSL
ncbi:hypothetical protein [Paenibacillus sp. GCM10027626]|uniref:hypothetical protein n=1 Tax=Paenibacillus sp. GCM10027626 TaxID=3273411 RepID=UPI003629230A